MNDRAAQTAERVLTGEFSRLIKQALDQGSTPLRLLDICSQLVGMVLAIQDPDSLTPTEAMALVRDAIERGNRIGCGLETVDGEVG